MKPLLILINNDRAVPRFFLGEPWPATTQVSESLLEHWRQSRAVPYARVEGDVLILNFENALARYRRIGHSEDVDAAIFELEANFGYEARAA